MNLTEITEEVRERIGERSADFFTADEVLRAINEAYKRFCNEEPWTWLLTEWTTTIAGDETEIELPENVSPNRTMLLSISGGDLARGYPLERLEPGAGFRYRFQRTDVTGQPSSYYITRAENDNGAITYVARILPTPATDYDVEALYYVVPDDLTGTDVPLVPDAYQEAIVARAAGKLFLKEFDISQKASEQFGIYYEVLANAREDDQNIAYDEVVAMGREMPLSRFRSERDYVMGRIPPIGLGQ